MRPASRVPRVSRRDSVRAAIGMFVGLVAFTGCDDTTGDDRLDALVQGTEDSLPLFEVDTATVQQVDAGSIAVEAHLDETGYRRIRVSEARGTRRAVETLYVDGGLPRVLVSTGGRVDLPIGPSAPLHSLPHTRAESLMRLADELLERGGEGTAWILYGFAHLDDGDSIFVRVEADWERPAIAIADFGVDRVSFTDVAVTPDTSRVAFAWPARASGACSLERQGESLWTGSCGGSAGERAMVLGGDYDPDLGQALPPSDIDVAIIDRASALIADPARWNRGDERVCTDDRAADSWSLFCALHQASIEVDGRYLHRRPAMQVAREVIWETAPERVFAHQLRDYNNSLLTTHDEVLEVLREARDRLAELAGG